MSNNNNFLKYYRYFITGLSIFYSVVSDIDRFKSWRMKNPWFYVICGFMIVIWIVLEILSFKKGEDVKAIYTKKIEELKVQIANYLSNKFICDGYAGENVKKNKIELFKLLNISHDISNEMTHCFAKLNLDKITSVPFDPILYSKNVTVDKYWQIAGDYSELTNGEEIIMTLPQNPYKQIETTEAKNKLFDNITKIKKFTTDNNKIKKIIILNFDEKIELLNQLGQELIVGNGVKSSKLYKYLKIHHPINICWLDKTANKSFEFIQYGNIVTLGYNNNKNHKDNVELVLTPEKYAETVDKHGIISTQKFFNNCIELIKDEMKGLLNIYSGIENWEDNINELGKLGSLC